MRIHDLPTPAASSPAHTRRLRIALGTWIGFEVSGKEPLLAQRAIELAFEAVRRVDALMHPHRQGSDLSVLNAAIPERPVNVDRQTWSVLHLAQRISVVSEGVFDPCLPSRPGRIADLELGADQTTVTCHAPMSLDLGGIAKGYAVDRAVEELITAGCDSGLVNAGGDLRVFGPDRRTIFLRTTDTSRGPTNTSGGMEFQPLELQNAALAVTDFNCEQRPAEHQGYYVRGNASIAPLVVPNPSLPPRQYVAVQAHSASVADALTKCALLCSKELADRVLRNLEATRVR